MGRAKLLGDSHGRARDPRRVASPDEAAPSRGDRARRATRWWSSNSGVQRVYRG